MLLKQITSKDWDLTEVLSITVINIIKGDRGINNKIIIMIIIKLLIIFSLKKIKRLFSRSNGKLGAKKLFLVISKPVELNILLIDLIEK